MSLLLHVTGWGIYEAGKNFGYWDRLRALLQARHLVKQTPPPQQPQEQDREIFVDVAHPEAEAPKKTIYYSDKNSIAANPDASVDSNQPKIDGKQKDVPKPEDAPRQSKLQPTPPPAPPQPPQPESPPQPQTQPQPKPQPQTPPPSPYNLGDVKLAKTETPNPQPKQPEQPQPPTPQTPPRPRTIKQALEQQHLMPGQAMHQDGGVQRRRVYSSLDAKATQFGEYDRAIIEAVQQRWYDLLDSHQFALDRTGRVTLHFRLMSDGSVQELGFVSNDAGATLGYLCVESIMEVTPFAKWPPDMRRMIGDDFRDITFTFIY